MAAKEDSEGSREERDQRIVEQSQCKLSTKEQEKATGRPEKIQAGTHRGTTMAKGGKDAYRGRKSSWQRGNDKRGSERTER